MSCTMVAAEAVNEEEEEEEDEWCVVVLPFVMSSLCLASTCCAKVVATCTRSCRKSNSQSVEYEVSEHCKSNHRTHPSTI